MGAGSSLGVGGSSLTTGAPSQLGIAPGTETSIHFPSWIEKKASSHGETKQAIVFEKNSSKESLNSRDPGQPVSQSPQAWSTTQPSVSTC